jgi:hypothetical protein
VQQCTKLTSTNRSIGLIAFIVSAHPIISSQCALRYLRTIWEALSRFALLERNG